MDIIIKDVEEKDGRYKIYNKDGTGGHWYISKESAEQLSNQVERVVMLDRSEISCENCGHWDVMSDDPLIRRCEGIKNEKNVKDYRNINAYVENNSDYYDEKLITHKNFGCKQFEPKLSEGTT